VEPIAERIDALGIDWIGMERERARRTRSVCVVALYFVWLVYVKGEDGRRNRTQKDPPQLKMQHRLCQHHVRSRRCHSPPFHDRQG